MAISGNKANAILSGKAKGKPQQDQDIPIPDAPGMSLPAPPGGSFPGSYGAPPAGSAPESPGQAIPGTFALPGSSGAAPFRTPAWGGARVGAAPVRFGAGSSAFGGSAPPPMSAPEAGGQGQGDDDEMANAIMSALRGRQR